MQPYRPEQEQEINLHDYINILIKRKKLIILIFLAAVIAVTTISFLSPEIYEISMVAELGSVGVSSEKGPIYWDSVENLAAKIEQGAFNLNITKALNLDPRHPLFKYNILHPAQSQLMKISLETKREEIDIATKALQQLFTELSDDSKDLVESRIQAIDEQKAIIADDIAKKNDAAALLNEKLTGVAEEEKNLADMLAKTRSGLEVLKNKRDALLDSGGKPDSVSMYSESIRQDISYLDQLNSRFNSLKAEKRETASEIRSLLAEINEFKIKATEFELRKRNISNIKLIIAPQVSKHPIKPNKKRNILLAGMTGLMIGAFLAFFMELLEQPKK